MCGSTAAWIDSTVPGHSAAARGLDAVLYSSLEHHLVADADAEHGPTSGKPSADDLGTAALDQPLHAGCERTDARHDQPVSVRRCGRVTGDLHLCTRPHQGPLSRTKVARAVVEQHDGWFHRLPLVLGTAVSRGSTATASRNARASALN